MTLAQTFQTLFVVFLMGLGQMLFKFSASRLGPSDNLLGLVTSLVLDPWFICALLVYALTTFLWVFVLRGAPLSATYPFVAIAVVAVPIASVFVFGETFSWRLVLGLAFIVIGIFVAAGK